MWYHIKIHSSFLLATVSESQLQINTMWLLIIIDHVYIYSEEDMLSEFTELCEITVKKKVKYKFMR